MRSVKKLILVALLTALPLLSDSYLFTSFRNNGETGVFLSLSSDGKNWIPLNGDQPAVKPEQAGMLMRDPWLGQDRQGTWHMLWTWGWMRGTGDRSVKIGHATSPDLQHWSKQEEIPLFQNEPGVRNAWAPEAVWDPVKAQWIVFWASTIEGRFPETQGDGDNGYNHRIYSAVTKDWKTFTPAALFFDPGYEVIDSTIVRDGKRWVMIFKDERKTPLVKALKVAFADSPDGPWKDVSSQPFTPPWHEGPTAVKIGKNWLIYADHYGQPQHYAAFQTSDWKRFTEVTPEMHFPPGQRHGTVVKIPDSLANTLRSVPK